MFKVFVEYKVYPECREPYILLMDRIRTRIPGLELLEAEDQEGLFLEIWTIETTDRYKMFLDKRKLAGHPDWAELVKMIPGGVDKMNIWRFRPI
ncbi:hypothetical protein [Paenibacillus koleovorans]|uniref:hypothetical protein n=1 Tax=Paenibacillus koleovorans TaxID=121608 RepID=UPI000FDABDCC|nr:hypothetical protein [Paenibacillus koleovorans]